MGYNQDLMQHHSLCGSAGPVVVRSVERLEGEAKAKRIAELNGMNNWELKRAENMAVTAELRRWLDEGESLAALSEEYLAPSGGRNESAGNTGRIPDERQEIEPPAQSPAPITRPDTHISLTSLREDGGNDSLECPGTPPTNTSTELATSSPHAPTADIEPPPVCVDSTNWPQWLSDHYERFSTIDVGSDGMKERWTALLGYWTMLERAMGLIYPVRADKTFS